MHSRAFRVVGLCVVTVGLSFLAAGSAWADDPPPVDDPFGPLPEAQEPDAAEAGSSVPAAGTSKETSGALGTPPNPDAVPTPDAEPRADAVIGEMLEKLTSLEVLRNGKDPATEQIRILLEHMAKEEAAKAGEGQDPGKPPLIPYHAIQEGWIKVFMAARTALRGRGHPRFERVIDKRGRIHTYERTASGQPEGWNFWTPTEEEKRALRLSAQVLVLKESKGALKAVAQELRVKKRPELFLNVPSSALFEEWRWDWQVDGEEERLAELAKRMVVFRMAMRACREARRGLAATVLERAVAAGDEFLREHFETVRAKRAFASQPKRSELSNPLYVAADLWVARPGGLRWSEECKDLADKYAGVPGTGHGRLDRERDPQAVGRLATRMQEVEQLVDRARALLSQANALVERMEPAPPLPPK